MKKTNSEFIKTSLPLTSVGLMETNDNGDNLTFESKQENIVSTRVETVEGNRVSSFKDESILSEIECLTIELYETHLQSVMNELKAITSEMKAIENQKQLILTKKSIIEEKKAQYFTELFESHNLSSKDMKDYDIFLAEKKICRRVAK